MWWRDAAERLCVLRFPAATRNRTGLRVAALDPFRGYATASCTSLPSATRVLDAFHVVRRGLDALDEVRRRVQQDTLGHRGHRDDPLFGIRRLLRRGYEHHSPKSWNRMLAGIQAGVDAQVQRAWIAAQELRLRGVDSRACIGPFTEQLAGVRF